MEMRYFWVCDQVKNGHVAVYWYPGLENLADYLSKHHEDSHHIKVRPIYLHTKHSPRLLQRALPPSVLRGCVWWLSSTTQLLACTMSSLIIQNIKTNRNY